ncbi:MAG TPA: hypothetical protein VF815_26330 [Myxococcaceae bacterium]|jgi:hypothetical protein
MRGCGWVLLALCLGACESSRQVPNTVEEPLPEVPEAEAQTPIPEESEPSTPEVPESVPGGRHLWTHELSSPGNPWDATVTVNDQGVTALLSLFEIPTDPELRTFGSIEVLGWDSQGQPQWRHPVPGKAPIDDDRYFPWEYTVMPHGAGFLVVNAKERTIPGSNIDFGCSEVVAQSGEADRLLFLDEQGKCTRAVHVPNVLFGVTTQGEDVWFARTCFGCAGLYWPPLQRRTPAGQLVHERPRTHGASNAESELRHDGVGTLLGWDDWSLSRQSESFDVLWKAELPIYILTAPAVLPDGEVGVVGVRLSGKGFSFGKSTLPDGTDLVLLRLSAQGEPLSAVATGVQQQALGENPLLLATDTLGLVTVRPGSASKPTSAVALSWEGETQWTQELDARLPGSCQLYVTSMALHPRHGLRVAGVAHGQRAADGACVPAQGLRRSFVGAYSR